MWNIVPNKCKQYHIYKAIYTEHVSKVWLVEENKGRGKEGRKYSK
jgi:hypothetical protein